MLHFYDESPIPRYYQYAHLRVPVTLLEAGIHHVVWGLDALGIVHRVPVVLFDLQLLVSPADVTDTAELICSKHPYAVINAREAECWRDYSLCNKDRPFAFDGSSTVLLGHLDVKLARERDEPEHILVHAATVYHFDIHDATRTMVNPRPPDDSSMPVLFPTLPAFYDSIIDTIHEPPLPFIHRYFMGWMGAILGYLNIYTTSEKGYCVKDGNLVPKCSRILHEVKEENRPYLSRTFFGLPYLFFRTSMLERSLIKEARCEREGVPFKSPTVPRIPWIKSDFSKMEMMQQINDARARNAAITSWSFPNSFRRSFSVCLHRTIRR